MNLEKFFQIVSYASVLCGFFALWVSGTFGFVSTTLFLMVIIAAWFLEGSRWQIGEKVGTGLIVLALPLFYAAWYFQLIQSPSNETWIAGMLARMILCLAAVKLLQKKSDRDWIFLYLMAFFEVLLAAGLSISALYLASFLVYLLVMVCSIIAFEIRKTSRAVDRSIAGSVKTRDEISESGLVIRVRQLPVTAVGLIVFIVALAMPLFFMLPRVGGAGFGGNQRGLPTYSGFSDTVRLGQIGTIQKDNSIVMRVEMEGNPANETDVYFRGIALDTFDNRSWNKSKVGQRKPHIKGDSDTIELDTVANPNSLIQIQNIYLEPLDTPVLFGSPRIVGMQGNFSVLHTDPYGSVSHTRTAERISYKVLSDRSRPSTDRLRADDQPYTTEVQSYRDLPPFYDLRIAELTKQVTAGANNRYDKAKLIESYLQTNFGYTLEQKASGPQPLADFLFNVREGHCEYFATAMAIMLRTQGVATRIVNGFHGGEYNDTAGVTVVRQSNAHAWVEVYFPREDTWITFDPTPFAGQVGGERSTGITAGLTKYIEALETFWIQYFVAFDNQEQRSLAKNVRSGLMDYQSRISSYLGHAQHLLAEWWTEVRGDKGTQASFAAIGYAIAYLAAGMLGILLLFWMVRKVLHLKVWRSIWERFFKRRRASVVEFYDRMMTILAAKGLAREPFQTPLEFAFESGIPEVVKITGKYNRVRFGERDLSRREAEEIEAWLQRLGTTD